MRLARMLEARRLGNGLPRDATATFRIAAKVVVAPGTMGTSGISRRPVIAATVRAASNPLQRECEGLAESGSGSAMQAPEFAMHGRK